MFSVEEISCRPSDSSSSYPKNNGFLGPHPVSLAQNWIGWNENNFECSRLWSGIQKTSFQNLQSSRLGCRYPNAPVRGWKSGKVCTWRFLSFGNGQMLIQPNTGANRKSEKVKFFSLIVESIHFQQAAPGLFSSTGVSSNNFSQVKLHCNI